MSNEKSLSYGENSLAGSKANTIGIISRPKFQNVEKLSTLVRQIQQNSNRPVQPQQILEVIKANIKSNYNRLYDNYETNKNAILKNIQQTESNDANEGVMKQKFQNVLKQKNAYDRLKVQIQGKQKKLKKLIQIRDQVKSATAGREQLKETLQDRIEIIKYFEQHKNMLEYETAVLEQMKKQREHIKLKLKQRHHNILKQQEQKNQRTKKVMDASHTKKIILQRIQQKIKQQDLCQIPQTLSQQLQKKLQQYQGKHTQQNILAHQKIINQQKTRRQILTQEQQQQQIRKNKIIKQKQQRRQFQITQNHFLLKKAQEQQIKRFCRVQSITDIANGNIEQQKKKLEIIQLEIQKQIRRLDDKNNRIRKDIEVIMTTIEENNMNQKINLLDLQKQLQEEEVQLRRLKAYANKKQNNIIEWESILQMMFNGKCDRTNMIEKLKKNIQKYQNYSKKQKLQVPTAPQTAQIKAIKSQFNKKFTKINYKSNYHESSQASDDYQI